ncbi:FAD-containing oxidoreductase [Occallatibacter savannae]|uniref:FAD-containing oxidoreductase n=1 Tax=Occallatibacter savannae TaxID=1002691 RepID=UPI000D69C8AF|nr:FAD-containing oxidoreductase [Occallatibacter savannae]
MSTNFDAIIIGSGQAGPFLAVRLAAAGRKVALIERKVLGGTCVNTGCTPTKAMVACAKVAQTARESARFGVHIHGEITVSLAEIRARNEQIVQNSRDSLRKMLENAKGCTVIFGPAQFISANEVQVGDQTLRGDQIFINVGGRAATPELPGLKEVPYLTNSTLLQLNELPRHLIVVGGGAVGVEFAQIFRRLGSEVTLIEMKSALVHREDAAASKLMSELLDLEGIRLRLNSECVSFSPLPDGVCVHVSCKSDEPEVHGSHALLAMGRSPNTNDLGLEAAGVRTDGQGFIPVDDQLRTNVPNIFALGDCNRRGAFTHTSYNDFEIVADNLLDGATRRVTDRIPVRATYSDPPLAQVGMTEEEARASGRALLMATRPMRSVARAIEKGETFGFMKVMVDPETKRILGATIFGVGGDEAIHCILSTMYADQPYTTLTHAVHIHPTVAELIPTLLGSLKPA